MSVRCKDDAKQTQRTHDGWVLSFGTIKSPFGPKRSSSLAFEEPINVILPGMQRHAELLELHSNLRCWGFHSCINAPCRAFDVDTNSVPGEGFSVVERVIDSLRLTGRSFSSYHLIEYGRYHGSPLCCWRG